MKSKYANKEKNRKVMKKENLQKILTKIKENNFESVNAVDCDSLAMYMFEYIGDTNPILRDELIYETYMYFCENRLLSDECMRNLFYGCQDSHHMLLELGAQSGDSVFVRSFSILLLVGLIDCHLSEHFLSEKDILDLQKLSCKCYVLEQNLMGYDDKKGWAHIVAHGADLLAVLSQNKCIGKEEALEILDAIIMKICQGKHAYIDNEPWRISQVIISIMKRKLLREAEWENWLNRIQISANELYSIEWVHSRTNVDNFLRVLYFSIMNFDDKNELLVEIGNRMKK